MTEDTDDILDQTTTQLTIAEQEVDRAFSALKEVDDSRPAILLSQATLICSALTLRLARHRASSQKEGAEESTRPDEAGP